MKAKKILIIEDDQDIREVLTEILGDEGYDVNVAGNGEEGLECLRQGDLPNLIILDLMMPVMDGFAFRAEQCANATWCDIPVIVMSADGHVAEKQTKVGGVAYLKKPPDLDDIIKTVAKHLH